MSVMSTKEYLRAVHAGRHDNLRIFTIGNMTVKEKKDGEVSFFCGDQQNRRCARTEQHKLPKQNSQAVSIVRILVNNGTLCFEILS